MSESNWLVAALDKAIGIQRRAVAAHVRRIRERHPEASPSDVIARLVGSFRPVPAQREARCPVGHATSARC
jgi:hypothetical protein